MALIITTLVGVIVWLQKKIDTLYQKNSDLQDKRLDDSILNRNKYDEVMGKFSQSFDLFAAKIQSSKDRP